MNDIQYQNLKKIVQAKMGLDLDAYKPDQMRRRIENFVTQNGPDGIDPFLSSLGSDPVMIAKLAKHLTINVTEFFRDPHMYEGMFNKLKAQYGSNTATIQIWSAGCSNGAEAYSLCMALTERMPNLRFSILATDVDTGILQAARNGGPYPRSEMKQVSPTLMTKYFQMEGESARFTHPVRQRVTFKKHNLLKDSYESGFDLILCRNVMIYFTSPARQQITQGFNKSLKPGGMLFVGSSEALLSSDALGFRPAGSCLYEKLAADLVQPMSRTA